jgi:hypothetical protein
MSAISADLDVATNNNLLLRCHIQACLTRHHSLQYLCRAAFGPSAKGKLLKEVISLASAAASFLVNRKYLRSGSEDRSSSQSPRLFPNILRALIIICVIPIGVTGGSALAVKYDRSQKATKPHPQAQHTGKPL